MYDILILWCGQTLQKNETAIIFKNNSHDLRFWEQLKKAVFTNDLLMKLHGGQLHADLNNTIRLWEEQIKS